MHRKNLQNNTPKKRALRSDNVKGNTAGNWRAKFNEDMDPTISLRSTEYQTSYRAAFLKQKEFMRRQDISIWLYKGQSVAAQFSAHLLKEDSVDARLKMINDKASAYAVLHPQELDTEKKKEDFKKAFISTCIASLKMDEPSEPQEKPSASEKRPLKRLRSEDEQSDAEYQEQQHVAEATSVNDNLDDASDDEERPQKQARVEESGILHAIVVDEKSETSDPHATMMPAQAFYPQMMQYPLRMPFPQAMRYSLGMQYMQAMMLPFGMPFSQAFNLAMRYPQPTPFFGFNPLFSGSQPFFPQAPLNPPATSLPDQAQMGRYPGFFQQPQATRESIATQALMELDELNKPKI